MEKIAKAPAKKTTTKAATTPAKTTKAQVVETAEGLVNDVMAGTKKVSAMTTKAVQETAEKVDFKDSVSKIKETANSVNTQIKATATEVMEEVKENTKEVTAAATKLATDVNAQLKATATETIEDVKENTKELRAKATKIATNVGKQLKETAADLMEDAKENGKELRATATKLAKEAVDNIKITERLSTLKKAVKNTNEFALETAEELIDGATANGEKWQKVTEKAVQSGLKLAAKQQEIMFYTLESVKVQLGSSAKRFKKLIGKN